MWLAIGANSQFLSTCFFTGQPGLPHTTVSGFPKYIPGEPGGRNYIDFYDLALELGGQILSALVKSWGGNTDPTAPWKECQNHTERRACGVRNVGKCTCHTGTGPRTRWDRRLVDEWRAVWTNKWLNKAKVPSLCNTRKSSSSWGVLVGIRSLRLFGGKHNFLNFFGCVEFLYNGERKWIHTISRYIFFWILNSHVDTWRV